MVAAIARHLRRTARSLAARPAYALVVLVTIALVVGPSTAVLAVINATLVRALPFAAGDRLVRLYMLPPGVSSVEGRNPLGSLDFVRFRAGVRQLESLAGLWARDRAIDGAEEPESVPAAAVSANLFDVLGASPVRGRTFTEDEDRANAKVVVLSFALWQRRFARDPNVVGRRLSIDREPYEIIGVMGPVFNPAYVTSELWTPLGVHAGNLILPNSTFIQSVGRLRPGVTLSQLQSEVAAVMNREAAEQPATRKGWTTDVATLRDAQFGSARPALMLLLAAIGALALIACANLTSLTVAEVANRRGELSLRAALGAGRRDLIGAQLVESALLAAGGGLAGVVLGAWMLPALLALDPASARLLGDVAVDWRVQAAAGALALAVTMVAGGLPVLAATRDDLAGAAAAGRRVTGSRGHRRVRFLLIAAETLFAVVLLTSGGLLVSAFDQSARVDPGFDPHHVLGAQLRLPASAYPTSESRWQIVKAVVARVRATPGVIDASTALNLFVPGFSFVTLVNIEGKPTPDGQPHTVQVRRISPGYFRTMRIAELRGRSFDDHDDAQTTPVAVVSRGFAEQFWPGEEALGRRVQRTSDQSKWLTVVGVVSDVRDVSLTQAPSPTIYIAFAQNNSASASVGLVVRTAGEPLAASKAVSQAVHEVDPGQPLSNVTTVDGFLRDSLAAGRFRSVVLVVFAALGLLLASVGIYGVTARGVAERTRELGVRLALGGEPAHIRRLVLARSMAGVAAGFAAGLPAALLTAAALRYWLPGVETARPAAAILAQAGLVVAGLIAAGVPALRAGRVDPLVALRE